MGLDQIAYTTAQETREERVNRMLTNEPVKTEEVSYWRKHNALHGWMEDLYIARYGNDKDFNCEPLQLTADDLIQLNQDIDNGLLVEREGFFFGSNNYMMNYVDSEDYIADKEFIRKGLELLKQDRDLYYVSWY